MIDISHSVDPPIRATRDCDLRPIFLWGESYHIQWAHARRWLRTNALIPAGPLRVGLRYCQVYYIARSVWGNEVRSYYKEQAHALLHMGESLKFNSDIDSVWTKTVDSSPPPDGVYSKVTYAKPLIQRVKVSSDPTC